MKVENYQLGRAPSSPVLFRRHGESWEQFNEQPKDEEYMEKFQYNHKFFFTHDYWRQSYNALHYQQEQFGNAVQEHQRTACEHVEIAAAIASSRTEARMISRFKEASLPSPSSSRRAWMSSRVPGCVCCWSSRRNRRSDHVYMWSLLACRRHRPLRR